MTEGVGLVALVVVVVVVVVVAAGVVLGVSRIGRWPVEGVALGVTCCLIGVLPPGVRIAGLA